MCAGDRPLITKSLWRNIVGHSIFQLAVMYTLVMYGDVIFGVPGHSALDGAPSQHFTIVFNAFVFMQLFNQVCAARQSLPRTRETISLFEFMTEWHIMHPSECTR